MQNTKKMTVSDNLTNLAQSEDELAFLEVLEDVSPQSCPKTPEEVDQFYRDNVKLLHSIVRPYRGLDEYEDLLQEASIGFIKAIQTYKPSKGVKLTTYAFICAQNEVRMYLRKNSAKSRTAVVVSLDTGSDDDHNQDSLMNRISGHDGSAPVIEDSIHVKTVFRQAMRIVEHEMDQTSILVIRRTMEGIPQSQMAKELNLSQSKVSKILSAASREIRMRLEEKGVVGLD